MKPKFLLILACSTAAALFLSQAPLNAAAAAANAGSPVTLRWLDGAPPATSVGVSWGVPWKQGEVPRGQAFALTDANGRALPLQTWPLAYWPDGSLKFTGFATVAGPESGTSFRIARVAGAPATAEGAAQLTVRQANGAIDIDTGVMQARLRTSGANLIESITMAGREVARAGQLVSLVQNGPEPEVGPIPAREKYVSEIKSATVEQSARCARW